MPTLPPPPPPKNQAKGDPPSREETRGNLEKPHPETVVALNFRVPAAFKKDFKIAAATYGITQSQLLQQAFKEWSERRG